MKKIKITLITLITITLVFTTTLTVDFSSNKLNNAYNQVVYENQGIKESFNKIADLKYDEQKCNCKHKSKAFAKELVKNGAKNVLLVTIVHESKAYSHVVVSWEGKVYDATNEPAVYGMPEDEYFDKIKRYGFNGLRITSPYMPIDKNKSDNNG